MALWGMDRLFRCEFTLFACITVINDSNWYRQACDFSSQEEWSVGAPGKSTEIKVANFEACMDAGAGQYISLSWLKYTLLTVLFVNSYIRQQSEDREMQQISRAAVDLFLPGCHCYNQIIPEPKFVSYRFSPLLFVLNKPEIRYVPRSGLGYWGWVIC